MPRSFWFDERNAPGAANGDPTQVLKGLLGNRDQWAESQLYDMYSPKLMLSNLLLPANFALFMTGTMEELLGALTAARDKGLKSISVTNGQLAVWYTYYGTFRGMEPIVCIAGRGVGPGHYWQMNDNQTPADVGPPASHWRMMFHISQPQRISLDDLINAILKVKDVIIPTLPPVSDEQRRIAVDVAKFVYQKVSLFRNDEPQRGEIFTGYGDGKFCHLRTHDKVESKSDPETWDYTGDKVHVSVDPKQVGEAWNIALPILIGNHSVIKDFKVTNMENGKRDIEQSGLSDKDAQRKYYYYYGGQISVYFRAAPGTEEAVVGNFVRVMKLVRVALANASIRPGVTPYGDLSGGDNYLSFRRDFDDLIDPQKVITAKKIIAEKNKKLIKDGHEKFTMTEDGAMPNFYIDPDRGDYEVHKQRMGGRLLLALLRGQA